MSLKFMLLFTQVMTCASLQRATLDPWITLDLKHMGIQVTTATSVTFKLELCTGSVVLSFYTSSSHYEIRIDALTQMVNVYPANKNIQFDACSKPAIVTFSWADKFFTMNVDCDSSSNVISEGMTSPLTHALATAATDERVDLLFGDDICSSPTTTSTTTTTTTPISTTTAATPTTTFSSETSASTRFTTNLSTTMVTNSNSTHQHENSGAPALHGVSVFFTFGSAMIILVEAV